MRLIAAVGCCKFKFFYSNHCGVTPLDTSCDYCVSTDRGQWPGGGEGDGIMYNIQFNVQGSLHHNNIPIYIHQDAKLHSLFYLETVLHVSGGTSTRHQGRKQLYLQHLIFVTPLLLPAAIVEELEPV
jgi:hypothetical protein